MPEYRLNCHVVAQHLGYDSMQPHALRAGNHTPQQFSSEALVLIVVRGQDGGFGLPRYAQFVQAADRDDALFGTFGGFKFGYQFYYSAAFLTGGFCQNTRAKTVAARRFAGMRP